MNDKQNTNTDGKGAHTIKRPEQMVENLNPKANENIRIRATERQPQGAEPAYGVGSEITDGEDA